MSNTFLTPLGFRVEYKKKKEKIERMIVAYSTSVNPRSQQRTVHFNSLKTHKLRDEFSDN